MIDLDYLQIVREWELQRLADCLPPSSNILEIGGGTGHQARRLAELGHQVASVDLQDSVYRDHRVYPIIDYDGHTLPFPDHAFGVVLSSHVVTSIPDPTRLYSEIRRVLAPGGLCIHLIATTTWRFWTLVGHYPAHLRGLCRWAVDRMRGHDATAETGLTRRGILRDLAVRLWLGAFPRGFERANSALPELWTWRRGRRIRDFSRCGFELVEVRPTRLIFTSHGLLGQRWSAESRSRWSRVLGSSSILYVLRPERK